MGAKSGTAIKVDRASLTDLAIALQFESRIMDTARVELAGVVRALEADGDILEGSRAELYKEALHTLKDFCGKVGNVTDLMRKVADEKTKMFCLEVDRASVDQKAMAVNEKTKVLRNQKLKGN